MAQKIVQLLVDDLTGEESDVADVENVEFSLDGLGFEIDLTTENAAKLREAFSPYIAVARRRSTSPATLAGRATQRATARSSPAPARRRPTIDREQSAAIREWANRNGWELSKRGRIPRDAAEAYQQHIDSI
jgi:hypothetical protein